MPLTEAEELSLLFDTIVSKSLTLGDFTLSSGQKTDTYVDCKLTTCSPHAIPIVGRVFLRKIAECGWRPDAIGGLTLGADPIAFAVAAESVAYGRPIDAFIVRKDGPKKHGLRKYIEGIEHPAGKRVVIVDDVCTQGDSTAQAIVNAKEAGMYVLGAICLVDREAGATRLLLEKHDCVLHSIFRLSELKSRKSGLLGAA